MDEGMPSEVALVFFLVEGHCLMQRHKNITHNFWSCRKSSAASQRLVCFFSASTTFSLFKSRFAIFKVFRYA